MEDQRTNLPLDIAHAIFEQFHLPDDAKTLGICSRVCKSWLSIARNHLFSDMRLQLIQNVGGIVPRVEPNEKWVEWNGYYKPKYADVSLVKALTITSLMANIPILTPPILSSTLASFPRLRCLRIHFARIPAPQSAADTPIIRSSLDKLELWNVSIPPNDFCNFMSLFPHTRSISINHCLPSLSTLSSPALSMGLPHTLQPSELSISDGHHSHWLDLFRRSHAVNSIRRYSFGFLQTVTEYGQTLDVVHFIAKLKNLESLVWDDKPVDPINGWQVGDPIHVIMNSRLHLFQWHIVPVFAKMQTLRSFSMQPSHTESHWDLYILLIQSLPQSLQHFEIYLTKYTFYFDLETFRLALARFTTLKSVRIVVMEWLVEEDLDVPFDDYADRLYDGLSDLRARGILKVVRERNVGGGFYRDKLVCIPPSPHSP